MMTIKLQNDYLHGPIWIYDEEGYINIEFDLITNDKVLIELNEQGRELFDSFYSFDVAEGVPCAFDLEGFKSNYDKMEEIVRKIKERLVEINDGSFRGEDYITGAFDKK